MQTNQNTPMRLQLAMLVGLICVGRICVSWDQSDAAPPSSSRVDPIPFAHAHNDYRHPRPLFDALAQGFSSVEADIFLVDGELLVAHERSELSSDRTLQGLYLEPLLQRVRIHGGRVYQAEAPFYLLIDIKSEGETTYPVLAELLEKYADMLTRIRGGVVDPGAVTVVLSGDTPREMVLADDSRLAGVDGRLTDLASELSAASMPMISDRWGSHFTWDGKGEMPGHERDKLRKIVVKSHQAGRVVRFWATPEEEGLWRLLLEEKVDLINTDRLKKLAAFARRERQ